MLGNAKVTELQTETKKVYDQIQKYLNQHNYNSEKTKVAYEADIKMFFNIMKDKEIEYLTVEDVQITLDDFEDYIDYLHKLENEEGKKVYVNKTINRKIASIKGLIKYLAAKKLVKDISYMSLIKSLPENANHYGVLSVSEVFEMAELAKQERNKGLVKYYLILFALDSCIRKSALLNMKWSNFVERENDVLVTVVDKGNKDFRQAISKEFYKELLTIKNGSEKVFDISARRVDDMMDRLRKKMQIPDERQIVFHSVRKSGISFRYRISGDLMEAKRAANHSSLTTTQIYIQEEDYGVNGAVSTRGKLDTELYKKVEHEILLKAISELKKDTQMLLNMKIQQILKENK